MRIKHQKALAFALLGATMLGGGFMVTRAAADSDNSLDATAAVQKNFVPIGDFTNLVQKVSPAVVSIDVKLKLDQTSDDVGPGDDSGDGSDNGGGPQGALPPGFPGLPGMPPGFPFGMMQGGPVQQQPVEAKGSGFIIDSSGIVVTNNHVVKDAATVSVELSDGTTYPAKILGTDPKTDLAVLKINAGKALPYVEIGSSSNVVPGEWVVAMGNPFGLGGSVTAGIVSALGRDIGDGPYDRFIQIDAPINEGNSGGPLFDQHGEVIGINTAILTPTGGSVGIGFAIPADLMKRVVTELVANGKVVRGYLGVQAQEISPQMAQAIPGLPAGGDPTKAGALIAAVSANSPAFRAGLQPGDVITKVNDEVVTSPGDLAADIAGVNPGQDTSITYLRNGKSTQISVAVATMPANPDQAFQQNASAAPQPTPGHAGLGLTLAPLTPQARAQLNLPDSANGAVIAQVRPNSAADQAGLQPGDLLVAVGPATINTPDDAVSAIDAAKKSGSPAVALRIIRQGQALFVGVGLGKPQPNQG